jgi:hypothetical protein
MPFAPTPWPVAHIVRYEDTSGEKDEHGNWPIVDEAPVIRYIYSYSQFGRRGSSRLVEGPEFQERTDTILHLAVPDPTLYSANDQIIMNPELDGNGDYVADSGDAYWIDGDPASEVTSPWPRYTKLLGGVVKIRRVT